MTIRTFAFQSKVTGTQIHRITAEPEQGVHSGSVLALQGLGDHSRCHLKAFEILCDLGYRVESFDWPGNGLSEGRRGDIPGVEPALNLIQEMVDSFDQTPKGIYAHSVGGFLALPFVSRHAAELGLEWLWLSAPLISPTTNQSRIKVSASMFLADWIPHLTVPTGIRPCQCFDVNSLDEKTVRGMLEGCHTRVSLGFGRDLILWEPKVAWAASHLKDPLQLLLTQGKEDQICPSGIAEAFFKTIPLQRKTLIICDSIRHEPLREPNNGEFIEKAKKWLAGVTHAN